MKKHKIKIVNEFTGYGLSIIGGIYDDRFLAKQVNRVISMMETTVYEKPYDGAKDMLLVDNLGNKMWLKKLVESMYDE